jgi:hypothetical protein
VAQIVPILAVQGDRTIGRPSMSEEIGARIFAFELGAMGALLLSAALLRRYGGKRQLR